MTEARSRRVTIKVQLLDAAHGDVLGEASVALQLRTDLASLKDPSVDAMQNWYVQQVGTMATMAYLNAFGRIVAVDPASPNAVVTAVSDGKRLWLDEPC